ncbi:MAG: hypothetical protein Q9216_004983 [Gyalolechia sp. 2 TL-2023]
MSWKESEPGCFERPLTRVETFFKALADAGASINREHWAIRVHARFCWDHPVTDSEAAVRHAWKTMRFDHPQIASFARGDSRVYRIPDPDGLASWLKDTFTVIADGTVDDLLASLRPAGLPSLYFLPRSSDILIQIPHWYIDGIGSICLLNNMFEAMAEPRQVTFGTEARNLSPGLEEAAGFPVDSITTHEQAALEMLTEYTSSLPSIGLPTANSQAVPGAIRRLALELPSGALQALSCACKARNLTVTPVLHAALIVATRQLAEPDTKASNYVSWGTFSLRRYLAPEFTDPRAHPVSLYLCGLPLTIKSSNFSAMASQLNDFYKQIVRPASRAVIWPLLVPFTQKSAAAVCQPPPEDMQPASEPVLSSIGVADGYLKSRYGDRLAVTRFWLGSEVLSREPLVYAWTWQDQLSLSVCYNEEFYTSVLMRRLLEVTWETLMEQLNIQIPAS